MSSEKAAAAMLSGVARLPDHVVYRAFVSETVVLNLKAGKYHGINPTGGRMLEVLEATPSIRAAAAQLAEEYGQPLAQIEQDVSEFCADLLERGLIEIRDVGQD